MSKLAGNAVQIGESGTISQNFVITQPTIPDGSLIIQRGTLSSPGALVAKINADGGVNTNGPTFSAYQPSAVALAATWQKMLGLTVEDWDAGGCFNNTGAAVTLNGIANVPAYAFCPNMAGYYWASASVGVATTPTTVVPAIYKNGSLWKHGPYGNVGWSVGEMGCIVYLNGVGDYIEAWNYSGVAQNTAPGAGLTWFQAHMVRAA